MLVRDLMKGNPPVLHTDDSIIAAMKFLSAYRLKAACVLDRAGKLAGVLTANNIITALAGDQFNFNSKIDTVMTKNIVSVRPDESLEEISCLTFQHLPVIDSKGELKGMLCHKDVAGYNFQRMCSAENALEQIAQISYNGIIIMDERGIILKINDVAAKVLRTTKENAVGHLAKELGIDEGLSEVIRSGNAQLNKEFDIGEVKFTANRTPIWSGCRVAGVVMTLNTATEREKHLASQLCHSNEQVETFNDIFESLCQGLIAVDMDGKIFYCNHAYEDMMGLNREDLIGSNVGDAVENSRIHIVLRTGMPEFGAMQMINNRRVIVNRLPMFKNGRLVGAIGQSVFKNLGEVEQLLKRNKQVLNNKKVYKVPDKGSMATFEHIIGTSTSLLHAKNLAAKVAPTDINVLIQGESGTGKDLFAQAIHSASLRKDKPFIAVNCASIPSELLESELFGYDEGAFTGAKRGGKKGKFELAEGGTIFLDEIGDMPLTMQAKLLRVIQNRVFEHVGGEKVQNCDVRIIAATNRNLEHLVKQNKFREDLFYRLNVVCIEIPALRQRRGDIEELVMNLMPDICSRLKVPLKNFSPEAMEYLKHYPWIGNIRELINFLEEISVTVDSMTILPRHLPDKMRSLQQDDGETPLDEPAHDEQSQIVDALKKAKGNKSLAAKLLGIHRSTLYIKMKKYEIDT